MNRIFIIIITLLLSLNISAQKNETFKPGEELYYKVKYGFLLGGKGSLKVSKKMLNGKEVIHTKAVGRTAGIFASLYNVKDIYESYINPTNDLPVKSVRSIKEGNYKRYDEASYNRDSNYVYSSRKEDTVRVANNAQDILSCFYFARRHVFNDNMVKGDSISLETYFAGEPFTIKILYKGKEVIDTKFGNILCYKFTPLVEKGRVFQEKDNVLIYISADENKIPIRAKFKIFLGSLVCELDGFRGLSNSFKVKTR